MPNTQQLRMEDMSEAYLRALCAANGYTIDKREHDNDGVDIGLVCSGSRLWVLYARPLAMRWMR